VQSISRDHEVASLRRLATALDLPRMHAAAGFARKKTGLLGGNIGPPVMSAVAKSHQLRILGL
jgi:hypothetical protein